MAHQSLYRRYRPRRFDEVRGQEHVVGALRNAVHNESEGHAYLFSGPRGTGKTSTARILAKALNCENLQQGEPCCECTPCQDMEAGRSFDLFELDAASNNGVDAIRDLIERSAVGSPGRTKVYILDEVHMLSPGASNALLKTLEEPPDHVRFVLATTDPQKVLPTIKSRTQHFEFQLLSAEELERQVRWIVADADLDVSEEAIAWVVHQGRGSSRDTLSALDQVVAAGGVVTRTEPVEQLYEALAERDTGLAVVAVADALAQGHDPRVLGAAFLDSLRDTFLVSLGVEVPHLMAADQEQLRVWAKQLGTQLLARAMESVGAALVEMRQAADPRVPLEVALVRLTASADVSFDALVERIEQLERTIAQGVPAAATASAAAPAVPSAASPAAPAAPAPAEPDAADDDAHTPGGGGPAAARAALAKLRDDADATAADTSAASERPAAAPSRPAPPAQPGRSTPTRAAAPPPVPGSPTPPAAAPTPPTAPAPAAAPAASTDPGPAEPPRDEPAAAEPAAPTEPAAQTEAAVPATASTPVESDQGGDPAAPAAPASSPEAAAGLDTDAVGAAFPELVQEHLKGIAKAFFDGAQIVTIDDGATVVIALALGVPIDRARPKVGDVESMLSSHFGQTVSVRLVEDGDAADLRPGGPPPMQRRPRGGPSDSSGAAPQHAAPGDDPDDEDDEDTRVDISQLENADVAATGIDRLTKAFPGAVLIDEDEVQA